jgi:type II secretory pathway component PulJ
MRNVTAFTLVEVIVALGLLGGGLVAVLAMFVPVARIAGASGERFAAVEAAAAVNGRLRRMPFAEAAAALGTIFLVSRDAAWLGNAADPIWNGRSERQFFAVEVRREPMSDGGEDVAIAPWLAFTLRVSWPAVAEAAGGQRVLVVAGSVHR